MVRKFMSGSQFRAKMVAGKAKKRQQRMVMYGVGLLVALFLLGHYGIFDNPLHDLIMPLPGGS